MANYGLATAASGGASAPKELGFLQRIEGAHSGLGQIYARLEGLDARISGRPAGADASVQPQACGLPAHLTGIEEVIRETLVVIGRLENSF